MEYLPLIENLPMDNPDAVKKKPQVNILQEMLKELMKDRNVTLAMIQKETKIPWTTLVQWHSGHHQRQKADRNLLELARYFNVSLEYLCFGIGSDEPCFEKFTNESA